MTEIADWFAEQDKTTAAKTALVLSNDPRSPDELASHAKIGQQLGLPPIVVGSDPAAYKARAEQKSIIDAVASAPKTAAWLANRDNGGLAKDDVENLSFWEKGLRDFGEMGNNPVSRGIARGVLSTGGNLKSIGAIQSGITAADIGKTQEQLQQEAIKAIGPLPTDQYPDEVVFGAQMAGQARYEMIQGLTEVDREAMLKGAADQLAAGRKLIVAASKVARSDAGQAFMDGPLAKSDGSFSGAMGAIAADPLGAMAYLGDTFAEALPAMVPAALTTIATRSPMAGAAMMGFTSDVTTTSSEAMSFLGARGAKLDTPEDVAALLANPELLKEAQTYGVTKGLIVGALDALSGGVAGKALAKSPIGDMVLQSIAQASLGGGGELLAQAAVDGKLDWNQIIVEGLAEFVTAPVEMASVGRGWLADQTAKAARAETTAGRIETIDALAAKSKLKARSPEKMAEFVDTVAGDKTFYVPADDLNELFQSKNFSPEDWGIDPAHFDEMLAAGQDVAVSPSVYATRITGTENADWFKRNAKTAVDELTISEADRFNETARAEMDRQMAELDRQRLADMETRASDIQVRDGIYTQLRGAGQTKAVAETNAKLFTANIRTLAARAGEDALDLARRFPLQVMGPQSETMRRRGDLDIALNTLRRDGIGKTGSSLTDFVVGKGGLQDIGGDLETMNPGKGVIAESYADVLARKSQPSLMGLPAQGKGRGIDDMARLAVEAGYFPDLAGQPEGDVSAALVAALREELAGRKTFIPGDEGNADLARLADELGRRGIDLAAPNDEIAKALGTDANGKTLFQEDYRGMHTAPMNQEGNASLVDVTQIFGDDILGPQARQYFGTGDDKMDRATIRTIQSAARSPEKPITIYRAVPDGVTDINAGDWVTVNRAYAALHSGWIDGKSAIIEMQVLPSEVFTDGNSIHEWGYDPSGKDSRMLFQAPAMGPNASITFPRSGIENGGAVVRMFESANLSSFQHEIGHYMLEVFSALASSETAPQDMKDDLDTVHRYLGMEPSAAISVDQHEAWARSWEAYLMEGKAPSLELLDVFSRFKAWMKNIYQTVRGLNVKISPEIRAVMDRMFATDEEIAAAKAEQAMNPLFTDEAAAGMSPAAFSTYQRMARRSTEQAEAALMAKTMAVERRKTEAWWKSEYKQVMGEVTETVNSQREYRLIEMLANQSWLSTPSRDVPNMQIDRKQLVDMFGAGILDELGRAKFGGKRAIYGDNGASPLEVSSFFGFTNPQEMIETLQNTTKRKDAIRAETDRIMRDRYGDPLTDGSIETAALEAIHSEQRAMTVAAEVRHLAARSGLATRNLTAQVFRHRAKLMIGRMSVASASNPDAFLAAGRRAAKGAEDAFARVAAGKGKDALVAATRHKEQQLLNHFLYLESRDFAREVASGRERMRNYAKASVRKKLDGGYIEQIDALLEDYDFRVGSKSQIARAESLTAFVQRMTDAGRGGEIAIDQRVIDRAKRTHYSKLSVDELRGLFDTIENIDHMGRFKQKLIDARRKRDLDASVQVVTDAVTKQFGIGKNAKKNYVRNTFNLLWTMDTMMMEYDGMQELGPVYDEVKRDIDASGSVELKMQLDLSEKVDALFKAYSSGEIAAMQQKKMIDGGNGRPWAKIEVLSVAMNMGNEANLQRMFDKSVHPDNRMTPDQADALVATLDARDWEFVKGYADLINSYWPDLSAVAERRTGVKPKKVDATPFQTPHGAMPGWYYPIKYDPALSARAAADEASAWDSFLTKGWGAKAEVNSGMTKERAATGGGRALNYDLAEGIAHMKATIRLIALSEAVDNSFRVLNDKRTVQAMQDAGRAGDLSVWKLWLKDVAQGPVAHSDPFSIVSRNLKNNFTLSRLAFNMKTVMMQSLGLAQSAAVIGKKNMVLGMSDYMKRPRELTAEVIAKSPFMATRRSSMDKDIHDFANDVRLTGPMASRYGKFKGALGKWGFAPMTMMQFYSVDMPTWLGAYRSGIAQFKDETKAIHYADRMIDRSQGGGLMADRTAFGRGTINEGTQQSEFIRLFSTLGGYMMTKMNRGYVTARRGAVKMSEAETMSERVSAATEAATNLMLLYVVEGVAMAGIYSLIYGEDKDDEDYAAFIAQNTAGSLVGGLPFGRDVATAFQGYGAGGVIGSVLEMPANLYVQAVQGENDKAMRRSAADLVGTVTGLPTTAMMRAIEALVKEDGPSMAEAIFGANPIGR